MENIILDGKQTSKNIIEELKSKFEANPTDKRLAIVSAGDDYGSAVYCNMKKKKAEYIGIGCDVFHFEETVTQEDIENKVRELGADDNYAGIMIQHPLPKHINEQKVILAISPDKDVDGFHPVSVGNLVIGNKSYLPCTPHGIIVLLKKMGIETDGKNAVVIGRSNIVGKPVALLLTRRDCNATVTICHTGTKNLAEITKQADILIAAVGKPQTVTADMVKPGAAVIDVGVNRIPDETKKSGFRLVGDVDFEAVKEIASFITPVPRGVGPMTIAMLMQNTLEAAMEKLEK
jgi:methylenetetrahydrofolate dehydrogenase (NADP+)/methenyltetrahydrofolate cyclohydrolase